MKITTFEKYIALSINDVCEVFCLPRTVSAQTPQLPPCPTPRWVLSHWHTAPPWGDRSNHWCHSEGPPPTSSQILKIQVSYFVSSWIARVTFIYCFSLRKHRQMEWCFCFYPFHKLPLFRPILRWFWMSWFLQEQSHRYRLPVKQTQSMYK